MLLESAVGLAGGIVAGTAIGDMFGAVGADPTPIVAATASAARPSATQNRKAAPNSGEADARKTVWLSATIVVVSLAVLGFGSKYLQNVRIA